MACPQQHCSSPVQSCLWLLLWSQAQKAHYCLFQRTLTSHDVPKKDNLGFVIFVSSSMSVLICSRTHLFAFLEIYTKELEAGTHLIAALFTIVKRQRQPKCSQMDELINKTWCVCVHTHTLIYYSALKRKKILTNAIKFVDEKGTTY